MVAGALGLPRLGQRPAEAEVGVVVDLVAFDHRLELDRGGGEAARAEVGAAERLAHRGLLRRPPGRLLQRLRRLGEVLLLEQLDPPPVEGEGGVGLRASGHRSKCRRQSGPARPLAVPDR